MPLRDYIPEPTIILLGCQPWPPIPYGAGCPVCGPGIREGHDSTYCGVCDSLSPRREAQVAKARRSVMIAIQTRSRAAAAEQAAKVELRRLRTLTEAERRRLWNGYKGGVLSPTSEVTNRSKVGRDWLTSIGQAPDWSLVLDARGNVIGRIETEAEVA